jgi:hypothetical protein
MRHFRSLEINQSTERGGVNNLSAPGFALHSSKNELEIMPYFTRMIKIGPGGII